jgi:predicted DNA-binding transcriptional regulator AlpA
MDGWAVAEGAGSNQRRAVMKNNGKELIHNTNGIAPRRLLSTDDIMQWLHVSKPTVYKLVALDGLPCIRLGHHTARYDRDMIQRWLLDRAAQGSTTRWR